MVDGQQRPECATGKGGGAGVSGGECGNGQDIPGVGVVMTVVMVVMLGIRVIEVV